MMTKMSHTCGLLESATPRLDNVPAEELEQHGAEVFERLPALLKQLFRREFSIGCSKSIQRSIKKHLKHCGKGMQLCRSLALLLLLSVVMHLIVS